jgi:hypothetical protein
MAVTAFVMIYAVNALSVLGSFHQLRAFLARTPIIADEACLARYKRLVRIQMYLALAMMGLLLGGIAAGMMLWKAYGWVGFAAMLTANVWCVACGLAHRSWEKKARSLEAGSEALAQEYRRVSHSWVTKPLPDF